MNREFIGKITPEHITALLEPITDPDLGIGIVDLGLVYDVRVEDGKVEVDMTLTSMGCPAGEYIFDAVRRVIEGADGVLSVKVNLVWDPPWDMERVNPEIRYALNLY